MNYTHGSLEKNTIKILIGFLGFVFPFLLILSTWLLTNCDVVVMDSISSYYHTPAKIIFLAVLFAVSYFFIAYNGYDRHDFIIAKIAACSLFFVAVFPTNVSEQSVINCHACVPSIFTTQQECPSSITGDIQSIVTGVKKMHYVSAFIFLLSLAYFSLILFPKSNKDQIDGMKKYRNWIYRICGVVILICLILLCIDMYVHSFNWRTFVFWTETVALTFFGISWIVKSQKVYGLARD